MLLTRSYRITALSGECGLEYFSYCKDFFNGFMLVVIQTLLHIHVTELSEVSLVSHLTKYIYIYLLQVPVQRVTKYPLLLARLYKATPPTHASREDCRRAKEKIELHLHHMNNVSQINSSYVHDP